MSITIAERYRPFSHVPGVRCLLPRTSWIVQAYPALIRFTHCETEASSETIEIPIQLTGPVREWTVQQDLEKGNICIWGIAREGRFRVRLEASRDAIQFKMERSPVEGLICAGTKLSAGDVLTWTHSGPFVDTNVTERLSLGSHRDQDWSVIWRRLDFRDIFPVLFHLGQWTPRIDKCSTTSMHQLIERGWEPFLRAAFDGVLSPRLNDDQWQGILPIETIPSQASPTTLITQAAHGIRRLFIEEREMELKLLSCTDFESGRMVHAQCDFGSVDLEWSKFTPRRLQIHARCDAQIQLNLPKPIHFFRIRNQLQDRGERMAANDRIDLEAGKNYWIDRFEK